MLHGQRIGLALAVLLATSAHAQAGPRRETAKKAALTALVPFTFKELKAGSPMDLSVMKECFPKNSVEGVQMDVRCYLKDEKVADVYMVSPDLFFWKNRLYYFSFELSNEYDYPLIFQAFTIRYGKPCGNTIEKWQNRAGAVFDNVVTTWCFSTGKLKLQRLADTITTARATYRDDLQPPSPTVVPDF